MAQTLQLGCSGHYLPLINNKNFDRWKFFLMAIMENNKALAEGVASCMKPDEYRDNIKKWNMNNLKAKSILISCLNDECLQFIDNEMTALEIIKVVSSYYGRKLGPTQLFLTRQLLNLKYDFNTR